MAFQRCSLMLMKVERKRDGAGKYGRIFEAQIQGFRQCTVTWEAPSAPLVDISSFERKPETGYGDTETKADQTKAYSETKADQTDDAYTITKADQTDAYTDTKADQTDGYEPKADQTDAYVELRLTKLMMHILSPKRIKLMR